MDNAFLAEYDASLQRTKRVRKAFTGSSTQKLRTYPLSYTLGKGFQKLFPPLRNIPVKNKLFWGDILYTYGYSADYYLCGCLPDEGEARFTRFLIKTVKPQDIFFDIGANVGFFSLLAMKLTAETVHAFEPTPETYNLLERNVLNKKITLNQIALSNSDGTTDFFTCDDPASSGINSLYKENVDKESMRRIVVKKMTLDHYCASHSIAPSFIKIDVEGAEADVIEGGLDCLKKYHPTIVMEVWPEPRQANHRKAIEILLDLGYKLFSIDHNGDLHPYSLESLKKIGSNENVNVVLKF